MLLSCQILFNFLQRKEILQNLGLLSKKTNCCPHKHMVEKQISLTRIFINIGNSNSNTKKFLIKFEFFFYHKKLFKKTNSCQIMH